MFIVSISLFIASLLSFSSPQWESLKGEGALQLVSQKSQPRLILYFDMNKTLIASDKERAHP